MTIIYRFLNWLDSIIPVECQRCHAQYKPAHIHRVYTTPGARVNLCDKCYKTLYAPWSLEEE